MVQKYGDCILYERFRLRKSREIREDRENGIGPFREAHGDYRFSICKNEEQDFGFLAVTESATGEARGSTELLSCYSNLESVDMSAWKRVGPDFNSHHTKEQLVTGILAVEAKCTDPTKIEEYNSWYNGVHVPDMLGTGLYHSAFRFQNVTPSSDRGDYLAIYETDINPERAKQTFLDAFRPKWIETGRVIDTMKLVSAIGFDAVPP